MSKTSEIVLEAIKKIIAVLPDDDAQEVFAAMQAGHGERVPLHRMIQATSGPPKSAKARLISNTISACGATPEEDGRFGIVALDKAMTERNLSTERRIAIKTALRAANLLKSYSEY
jgi:hypothetical protein